MTVSVALATFNGARHIDEQLSSLALQQRLPDELVVTDDASSDDTVARVEAFAATAPFPVFVHRNNERVGYRANFMRAAGLCRSELIAFCDQDDVWEPQKLAVCAAPFDDPEVLLVYHDALIITADGKPVAPIEQLPAPPVVGFLGSRPMDYALGFTQLLRRSLLRPSGFWHRSLDHKEVHRQERMAHDQWFFFLASVLGSISRIDQPLVRYRQHGSNSYGWSAPSRLATLGRYFWPSLRGRAEEYAALEKGAGCRAAILEQLEQTVTGKWQTRTTLAAEKYRDLENLYRERHRLYGSVGLVDRAAAFRRILTCHGYRAKGDWGLGRKALITDFCLGLPAGHRLSAMRTRLTPDGSRT
jgi:glycosyltransferase involved in cell wall biosynthesis